MNKNIRKAVRTFLINNNNVVVIKYKEHDSDYYDIPGGKIEDFESSNETSIREFKEETGITITKQRNIGCSTIEYPDRIYEFDIYIVDEYIGEPQEFSENNSMWFNIDNLFDEEKIFPSIYLIKYLKNNMNIKIICDSNHKIISIENK